MIRIGLTLVLAVGLAACSSGREGSDAASEKERMEKREMNSSVQRNEQGAEEMAPKEKRNIPADAASEDTITTMSGLRYIVVDEGSGRTVESGMTVKVDYAGFLSDGTIFDTSMEQVGQEHGFDRGGYPFEPIEFVVGIGRVIPGWDEGLTGMKVDGRRRLIIPAELGYGSRGAPPAIPPNATLIFDVHVLDAQ